MTGLFAEEESKKLSATSLMPCAKVTAIYLKSLELTR